MGKKNKTDQTKTVEPIRKIDDLDRMKQELKNISYRDYIIFLFGINTGLRISDILKLKVSDVKGKDHIWTSSTKTHKSHKVYFKNGMQKQLQAYAETLPEDGPLFPSHRDKKKSVDIHRVYRVLNKAGKNAGITSKIGTHTMRKTFGYHYYKKFKDVAKLQEILQHSAPSVTLKYIGIQDEEIENTFNDFEL